MKNRNQVGLTYFIGQNPPKVGVNRQFQVSCASLPAHGMLVFRASANTNNSNKLVNVPLQYLQV